MKLILFTGVHCPKCPQARKVVRQAAKELGWIEGKDFVEKLIDGQDLKIPSIVELEGNKMHIVSSEDKITASNIPAAIGGKDLVVEALMYQIVSSPAIVINERAVLKGNSPSKEELLKEIKNVEK